MARKVEVMEEVLSQPGVGGQYYVPSNFHVTTPLTEAQRCDVTPQDHTHQTGL